MRFVLERRTYELRDGEWIEHGLREPRRPLVERIAALAATALAIALIAAIGIVATGLALVLLPVALFFAWLASIRSRRTS